MLSIWMPLKSQKPAPPDAPNIVFLFSDDQSVPDLGSYGNQVIQTPNLDQLASEGIRFNRAYATSSQCSPSRASILTGRIPHDVHASRLHSAVPQSELNLIKLLNENGYYTGAYRKVHQSTIKDDFQFYGNKKESFTTFFDERPDDQPFFLWFGSTDPHRPYGPGAIENPHDPANVHVPDFLPDTPKVRKDIAYYYDEIARFDKECGKILSILNDRGLTENTIIVMSSDNGMPFPRSKATLYEPGIKVPLLIKWPGVVSSGQVSEALVSLMDLTATWLEAAGIPVPEVMQSRSLLPVLNGNKDRIRDYVYAERNWHDNWDPMRSIIGDRYKLIQRYRPEFPYTPILDRLQAPSFKEIERLKEEGKLSGVLSWYDRSSRPQVELYNLVNDPGEWNNLAETTGQEERVDQYQLELSRWMNQTHDFLPPPSTAFPGGPDSKFNKNINPLDGKSYESEQKQ